MAQRQFATAVLTAAVFAVACARIADERAPLDVLADAAIEDADVFSGDAGSGAPDSREDGLDSTAPVEDSLGPHADVDEVLPDSTAESMDVSETDAELDSRDVAPADTAPCTAPGPTDTIYVAPWGNDTTGNGGVACPTKTVTRALKLVTSSVTTVMLERGSATSPNIYGSGCTGGPPCDEAVSTVWSAPVLLRGSGTRDEVVVRGGASSVISLSGGGVAAMTIESTNTMPYTRALALSGFASPAPAYARDIRVRVSGAAFGIEVSSGPSVIGGGPGEGVEVTGGERGIALRFEAAARILSTKTAPTIVRGTSHSCIDVAETSWTPRLEIAADPDAPVVVSDCGYYGVDLFTGPSPSSAIDGIEVRRGSGKEFAGLRVGLGASLTLRNAKLMGLGLGIEVLRGSLVVSGLVDVSRNYQGLAIGEGRATVDGLLANDCTTHGVSCTGPSSALEMRNSTVLGNGQAGVLVTGACDAKLGGVGAGNVFNRTSHRNVRAGVCYLPNPKKSFSATDVAWSCGHVGSTCTSGGTPVVTYTDGCEIDADVSLAIGASAPNLAGHSCCN